MCIKGRHWPIKVVLIGFADFNAFLSTGVSLPGLVIIGPWLAGASVNAFMPVTVSVRQIGAHGSFLSPFRVLSTYSRVDSDVFNHVLNHILNHGSRLGASLTLLALTVTL